LVSSPIPSTATVAVFLRLNRIRPGSDIAGEKLALVRLDVASEAQAKPAVDAAIKTMSNQTC
jgi:hypothetical protein